MRYLSLLILISFISCSPKFNYLGDSYDENKGSVDVYYDIGDIEKDFKVMGILTADTQQSLDKSTDNVKKLMIEKAKTKGADAILFINIYGAGDSDNTLVESKLIKYK